MPHGGVIHVLDQPSAPRRFVPQTQPTINRGRREAKQFAVRPSPHGWASAAWDGTTVPLAAPAVAVAVVAARAVGELKVNQGGRRREQKPQDQGERLEEHGVRVAGTDGCSLPVVQPASTPLLLVYLLHCLKP